MCKVLCRRLTIRVIKVNLPKCVLGASLYLGRPVSYPSLHTDSFIAILIVPILTRTTLFINVDLFFKYSSRYTYLEINRKEANVIDISDRNARNITN